jgi:signal transduction histidine kinase
MDKDELNVIRRIASVVGHELRNPLAVINNSAYFLKTKLGADGRLDPKVEKHLGIVASEIARANQMVEDILVYSRVMEPQKKPVDLAPIAAAVLAAFAVQIESKLPKKGLDANADEKLVGDALRRLVDNAIQAGAKTITVSGGKEKGSVWLEVSDDGPGVDPKVAGQLGEAFITTKPKGLGLGLAMARKVCEAHGGKLEVPKAAKGARFRLVLPA